MITLRPVPQDSIPGNTLYLLYNQYGDIIRPVEAFMENLFARGMAATTLKAYAYDLLCFYRFLDSDNISAGSITAEHTTRFILALRNKGAAPRTINRRIASIRAFLNFHRLNLGNRVFTSQSHSFYKGRRNKALLGNTRIHDKKKKSLTVKVPSTLIIPLSPPEVKQFLNGLRLRRDLAIVYLMLFCGLRTCEVLALEKTDIDRFDNQIRVRGKGQKERILPLSKSTGEALSNYLHYERPSTSHNRCFVLLKGPSRGTPMNPEALRMIFRHRRKHSINRANPHLFRHTFCTNMISQGVSLPVVQKLMGHTNIDITMDYVHMSINDVAMEFYAATESLEKNYETRIS